MPLTMAGFAIAALAMVGIPPTAGFFSKFYLVVATVELGNWVLATIIVGSSALTGIYFLRLFEQIFVREPEEEVVDRATEPNPRIVATVGVLAVAVLAIGLGNAYLVRHVLRPVADALLG
jgi:multicomponent Na+:H+ antiporter subunit D